MIFKREFHKNEADAVASRGKGGVSAICQPPVDGSSMQEITFPVEDSDFVWTSGLVAQDASLDSEGQMRQIFEQYSEILKAQGLTIADNCVRTWIFVRDIDNNYGGVVKGRKDYFAKIGLTEKTHYIASTGINGSVSDAGILVSMDAVAVKNLDTSKVKYLTAPENLNPTYEYGVTFERGTLFSHNGKNTIFISGTASIDKHGEVMFVGDAARQTERTLDNIEALLRDGGASLDMAEAVIVYLRYPSDAQVVKAVLKEKVPYLKYVMVHAPVCRPKWLVEIECMARF